MMRKYLDIVSITAMGLVLLSGCKKHYDSPASTSATQPVKMQLTLDWKPEPEFGGFYAAQLNGAFQKHGLDVSLKPAGEGAPTWQLVAAGKTEFATTAADQVLIARSQGADVVAIFAVYQTFPQGIMVHKARGLTKIDDVFENSGILAAEDDTWLHFCLSKFPSPKVKVISYNGGVAAFLAKPDYSQQCFVTSEPILAKNQAGDPQVFLIADVGYNPYTTVVICKGDLVRTNPAAVRNMIAACTDGWRAYLDDPSPANAAMGKLNPDMDAPTFAAAAAAQKPLIEISSAPGTPVGTMTADRWQKLGQQLTELKVISTPPPANQCFVDSEALR